MKQKNPIRTEIAYLWIKENLHLKQERETGLDGEFHKMSGKKNGKKSLEKKNAFKRFISS